MSSTAIHVTIQRANGADAKAIATILFKAFTEFEPLYTKEAFAVTVAGEQSVLARMREGPTLVALYEGRPAGTASVVLRDTGVYIRGLAVLPQDRGLGIGHLLLNEIESFAMARKARRLFLSTTPFLTNAISLYQKFGFRRTKDGPPDLFGTPLFTMEKALTDVRRR